MSSCWFTVSQAPPLCLSEPPDDRPPALGGVLVLVLVLVPVFSFTTSAVVTCYMLHDFRYTGIYQAFKHIGLVGGEGGASITLLLSASRTRITQNTIRLLETEVITRTSAFVRFNCSFSFQPTSASSVMFSGPQLGSSTFNPPDQPVDQDWFTSFAGKVLITRHFVQKAPTDRLC